MGAEELLSPPRAHLLWVSSADASSSPAPGPWLLSRSFSSVPSAFWDKDSPFTGAERSAGKRQAQIPGHGGGWSLVHPNPQAGCPFTQG